MLALLLVGCSSEEEKAADALRRADRAYDTGQFEEARIDYLNVLRVDPRHAAMIDGTLSLGSFSIVAVGYPALIHPGKPSRKP